VPDQTDADSPQEVATLLTGPHNYAIVQLPGRRFPGVVVQGDSLSILCEQASRVARLAVTGTPAHAEAEQLLGALNAVLLSYVDVLDARSIPLPFKYPLHGLGDA
jgi:hypothetical protein